MKNIFLYLMIKFGIFIGGAFGWWMYKKACESNGAVFTGNGVRYKVKNGALIKFHE